MPRKVTAREKVAAGGVVVDRNETQARVLLVHRSRYDDWSLPKGGKNRGETVAEAALRETKEETGVDCRIIETIDQIRYPYRSHKGVWKGRVRQKVVHYFLMEAVGGSLYADGSEVDDVRWFDIDAAIARLTYAHDRELLIRIFREGSPDRSPE